MALHNNVSQTKGFIKSSYQPLQLNTWQLGLGTQQEGGAGTRVWEAVEGHYQGCREESLRTIILCYKKLFILIPFYCVSPPKTELLKYM